MKQQLILKLEEGIKWYRSMKGIEFMMSPQEARNEGRIEGLKQALHIVENMSEVEPEAEKTQETL